jgi:hypothetical protein
MNSSTNDPLTANFPTILGSLITGATPDVNVKQTNFIMPPTDTSTTGPPIASGASSCVHWVDKNYGYREVYERDPFANMDPQISGIYQNRSDLRTLSRLDSTFRPDPKHGWLNPVALTAPPALIPILNAQTFPWAIVNEGKGMALGYKNMTPAYENVMQFSTSALSSEPGKGTVVQR